MSATLTTETPPGSTNILPLRQRKFDLLILTFFFINILFITYVVDLEQLVISNPYHYSPPIWPPAFALRIIHSYGSHYDPLLMARPVWWKATIWIDALLFGPFYVVGIYAFIKGKHWIRLPGIIYASVMMTNVTIILSEEIWGPHATPHLGIVLADNAPWLIVPLLIIIRMWPSDRPFCRSFLTRSAP
ncbi:MAG: EXPERA domain-containing protein [Acidimicrobiales bacterium]